MSLAMDHRTTRLVSAWRLIECLLMIALVSIPASALNPSRKISQYAHNAWRMQDEVFGGTPTIITQTADGYLWIGTNIGLVRFDGVRFVPWNPPPGKRLLDSRVFSLLGARDGSLWIGTGYSLSHWKNGELTNYPQLSGRIESLVEDSEGAIWLVRTQETDGTGPVCRMKDERLRCYGATDAYPFPYATQLAKSDLGELWIGGYSGICRWKPGSSTVYSKSLSPHPEAFATLKAITAAKDGSVWAAVERKDPPLRLDHIGRESRTSIEFPGIAANNAEVTALFVDGNNYLWIGTAHHGIYRAAGTAVEHFGSADGLSSDAVGSFFQDAEGTLWVVTAEGIDNFRDLRVATYSMREGLSAAGASSVLAARDGTVWIGNFQALDYLRDGKFSAIRTGHGLHGRFVTTLLEDHAGRLWVGVDSGLWVYDRGVFHAVSHPDGSSIGTIFAIAEDTDHSIWVRAGLNLDRIKDLKLQQELTSRQISTAYTLAANPVGGLILGLVNGDLVKYKDGVSQTIPANETGNTQQIRDLLVDPDGSVWGTTVDELARWKDGKRKNLTTRNGLPCDGIFALVKDASGALWLFTRCGLVRMEMSELERWWQHPETVVNVDLIDEFDGVKPGLTSLKPQATRTPDGRLWFVNGRILQLLDPTHSHSNAIPPPVQLEEIIADRRSYAPGKDVHLPALTHDLEIDYTALSFIAPRRVRFRYRLEGRDAGWQDPGTRRQAFYSDLPPGKYRFHVIACNNDGVWNQTGASLDFVVTPAYYQTVWFRLVGFVAAAGLLWIMYLYRLRQVTAQIQERLGARLEERERIARELHDTLLQGFQGLVLRFQGVLKQMPRHDPARDLMENALDRADEVLLEGRQRVRELRAEGMTGEDLPDNLARCAEALAQDDAARFTLCVVGSPQALDPTVCNEAYRIGREAMTNAFQHSRASKIEAEITYDHGSIRLVVRDDGRGIDQRILNHGLSGHWGLPGMRERAEKIGAQLSIWSQTDAGTEIDLRIPARIAYPRSRKVSRWHWVKKTTRRAKGVEGDK